MIALALTIAASVTVAFVALEATLRIDPMPDPLPLEGWTL